MFLNTSQFFLLLAVYVDQTKTPTSQPTGSMEHPFPSLEEAISLSEIPGEEFILFLAFDNSCYYMMDGISMPVTISIMLNFPFYKK